MSDDSLPVAQLSDLSCGRPVAAHASGLDYVVVPSELGPRVYEGRCPHQGTLLSEGEIKNGELICRAHGYRYRCSNGERVGASGPALLSVPSLVKGSAVWVDRFPTSRNQDVGAVPRRSIGDLKGPRAVPIFGNLLQINVKRLHLHLEDWAKQYGPIYRIHIGRREVLVVSDPKATEMILRARPTEFRRAGAIEAIMAELGASGVFSAEGANWRRQRKLAMDALSSRHLRDFYPVLLRVGERLRARFRKYARSGVPFDIQKDLMRFTVDVTTSLAFGADVNTLEHESDPLDKYLSLLPEALARRIFAPFPYWHYVKLPKDRRLEHALREIRQTLGHFVKSARDSLASQTTPELRAYNFLQAMLLSQSEEGDSFAEDVILGNTLTMLIAGEDTTAHSIAWVVHEICDRPSVLAALQEEVESCLGDASFPLSPESADRMPYLEAVIQESMRLRAVAPFLALQSNCETTILDVSIPKDTVVYALLRAPSKDPRHLSKPEDFLPERWLPSGGESLATHIPFGSGPRICPGRSLALLEMRVVLAMLLKEFALERCGERASVTERFAFTVHPENLRVRLRPRRPKAVT